MGDPVFLLGAGFNLDANSILPPMDFTQPGRMVGLTHDNCPSWELADIPLRYPTVNELVRYCFGPDVDLSLGAERLFTDAYSRSDWVVLRRLTTIIQGADHYIATPLAGKDSVYSRFYGRFPKSTFISYNYDCLAELCLQAQGSWNPQSGFGVHAEVRKHGFTMGSEIIGDLGSSTEIFHLHGSLYLYPVLSDLSPPDRDGMQWLTMRPDPRFLFDPDSLGSSFPSYERPSPGHGYSIPEERFIPPISGKAESIEQDYYAVLFGRAVERVRKLHRFIAIGYSFAPSDRPSYDPFLCELFSCSGNLLIVSPSAQDVSTRLRHDYQSYSPAIDFLPMTFSQWVNAGYPKGLEGI